jgi:transposase
VLETGAHSPWVSRQLTHLGHEVIVAHARNVRFIGESSRKDDQLDARTLARLARIDPGFSLTYNSVKSIVTDMHEWYFKEGGIYLSKNSRNHIFT